MIKQQAPTLAAAQKKYKESVIAVNTQMAGVISSSLPVLLQNPPDWNNYQTAYLAAKGDALDWTNNVLARLLNVPQEVQNYNAVVTAAFADAITQVNKLIANPNDSIARAQLAADLKTIGDPQTGQLQLVKAFIAGAANNIGTFQNKLPGMVTQLQNIADMATKDAGVDQKKIEQLKADVAKMQAEIDRLVGAMVALGIVDATAISLATLASFIEWPIGALVGWLIAAPVIAIATYYLVIDGMEITNLKAKIGSDAQQMSDLEKSVTALHLLTKQFAGLADTTKAIEADVKNILAAWTNLSSEVSNAIAQILAAIANEATSDFGKIKTELTAAQGEWNSAYQQAGDLVLNLVVKQQSTPLQIGMTPAQVKAAVDSAPSIGVLQYYNQASAAAAAA